MNRTFVAAPLSQIAVPAASAQVAPPSPVTGSGNTASPGQGSSDPDGTGDIVVTAQKRSENLQNVPIVVTVLNA